MSINIGTATNATAYDRVKLARDNGRPTGIDYIKHIFTNFIELHGDRRYADDPAVVGGIAELDGSPVTVIAIEKGHTAKERAHRNFGAPHPEGYRKALRLMKQAEKFGRPVICLIDTSGAYCGISAEERGQGRAIAENLTEMTTLCVPIISILIGEGGSGGALSSGGSRPSMDAAKRGLLGNFARRLREYFMERFFKGGSGGGETETHGGRREKFGDY